MKTYQNIVKIILGILHQDGILDCNQYQGKDFDNLLSRITLSIQSDKPKVKYEIYEAKDDYGNDVEGKWEIINTITGNRCGDKFYDSLEEAYPDLSILHFAEELPLPKTSTPEETRIALIKKIISAFNTLDSGEILDVLFGNRGDFSSHGRGDGAFKISEDTCIYGNEENIPCQYYEGKCMCEHYTREDLMRK